MTHINEEQISAYLDEQLNSEETLALEVHFRDCENCRAVRDEFLEVSNLFRNAGGFEPSPFLWNRIAADFDKEKSATRSWLKSFAAGLRKPTWNLRFASAAMVILMIAGVVVFRGGSGNLAEQSALADINRTYESLAALDPDSYNPFGSGVPHELDANPFKNLRKSGEKPGIYKRSLGND